MMKMSTVWYIMYQIDYGLMCSGKVQNTVKELNILSASQFQYIPNHIEYYT